MEHISTESLLHHNQQKNVEQVAVKHRKYSNVYNDRMAGTVPRYETKAQTERTFEDVLSSYAPQMEIPEIEISSRNDETFGFLDVLDMVNPLQHIPLVNLGYRAVTGDEIKPVSKVIGGGVFGGPAGVAVGIVNALMEAETGKDMLGNATAFAGVGETESITQSVRESKNVAAYDDLSLALLSQAPSPIEGADDIFNESQTYQRMQLAQGRTAGTIAVYA